MNTPIYLIAPSLFLNFSNAVNAPRASMTPAGHVESFQWSNRLLLIRCGQADRRLTELVKLWSETRTLLGAEERQMLLLWGPAEDRGDFEVSLIGKDGGVKSRWSAPVGPADVFQVVDAMPMRRAEAR